MITKSTLNRRCWSGKRDRGTRAVAGAGVRARVGPRTGETAGARARAGAGENWESRRGREGEGGRDGVIGEMG